MHHHDDEFMYSVLGTNEVLDILKEKNITLNTVNNGDMRVTHAWSDVMTMPAQPTVLIAADDSDRLIGAPMGSTDYSEFMVKFVAKHLFRSPSNDPISFRIKRHSDYREYEYTVNGVTVLRGACIFGFQNIQNLLRKIKNNQIEYDFVEVMACPAGCLNGGAQLKPEKGTDPRQLLQVCHATHHIICSKCSSHTVLTQLKCGHWIMSIRCSCIRC